jgi:ketosteroid isomerase-like protein
VERTRGWTHRGREGVREALETWLESYEEYRYEVQRIVDCSDDEVLVVGFEVGRGSMSGVEVRSVSYELLTFRDGKIVRFREFHEESEALEAAGLSE